MRTTARREETLEGLEPLMKRMRDGYTTVAVKYSSIVALNGKKRLNDDVRYLVRDGNCIKRGDISSQLEK